MWRIPACHNDEDDVDDDGGGGDDDGDDGGGKEVDTCRNHTKGGARKDVGIVSLSRLKPDRLCWLSKFSGCQFFKKVVQPFPESFKGGERRPRGKYGFPLRECVRLSRWPALFQINPQIKYMETADQIISNKMTSASKFSMTLINGTFIGVAWERKNN